MGQDTMDTTRTDAPRGFRRGAHAVYRWLLAAFLAMGVVQIFLAGLGVFALRGRQLGDAGETAFDPHRGMGFALSGVALFILVLALLARPGVQEIVLSAVLFLLAFIAQGLLADLGEDTAFFGGLHAADGLAILGIAGYLYARSRRR